MVNISKPIMHSQHQSEMLAPQNTQKHSHTQNSNKTLQTIYAATDGQIERHTMHNHSIVHNHFEQKWYAAVASIHLCLDIMRIYNGKQQCNLFSWNCQNLKVTKNGNYFNFEHKCILHYLRQLKTNRKKTCLVVLLKIWNGSNSLFYKTGK